MQQTPQHQPQNRMGMQKIPALLVSMGLPMILSMVLQALYNVVDTMFVINMGADGALGNIALSAAFPVQILMIAIGVGTGVGINAMLSQNLGAGEKLTVNRTAGNGLFLASLFYAVFLAFGLFLAAAVSCAFLLRCIHKQIKMQQTSPNDAQNHASEL